jgi:type IV pilus assembly protein PilO
MAIQLPPVDAKGKNALAVLAVVLIGAGAFWYYLWNPEQQKISVVAAHADTLETSNKRVELLVNQGLEAKIRADADRYTAQLAGLRQLVPTENEVPALLDAVSSFARQSGLEVSQFVPDGGQTGDDFDMAKYKFAVTGPYHRVAEFLTAVASSQRILAPINLNLAPGVAGERRPKADEQFISANFGIMTYVAKTKVAPPPARPAAGPAKPGAK